MNSSCRRSCMKTKNCKLKKNFCKSIEMFVSVDKNVVSGKIGGAYGPHWSKAKNNSCSNKQRKD